VPWLGAQKVLRREHASRPRHASSCRDPSLSRLASGYVRALLAPARDLFARIAVRARSLRIS
jgi:hypothetical protein